MPRQETGIKGDRLVAYAAVSPMLATMLCLVAVPAISVFAISVQRVSTFGDSTEFAGFDNFASVIADPMFRLTLWNTAVWVFGSVALELTLGLGFALVLHQKFFLRSIIRTVILVPYLIPTVVAVLTWRFMFHDIVGILNYALESVHLIAGPILWLNSPSTAMISVIMIGVWKFFPFSCLAILAILQTIPQEQYEAAQIDGAGSWQIFWRITLPHILPVFLLTALLRTIWAFNKFDIIYLLTGGGPLNATTTLPVMVYLKAFVDFDFGQAAAVAVITFLIMTALMVLYMLLMRKAERNQ
ncbi:carbohydrate ABC transporter permease [Rhizobium mayense]|uniref:Sugar ABC transporter permease n=1 Tax=Rhizobium mayense TaxID=1312184 RepID=A0ABT7JSR1_9HYPH|nr:sugar ABC transporter permease [Rhizobium mayense]MDL2398942.1 sugar ABC transporter permease [Rhizobium mayense]